MENSINREKDDPSRWNHH